MALTRFSNLSYSEGVNIDISFGKVHNEKNYLKFLKMLVFEKLFFFFGFVSIDVCH